MSFNRLLLSRIYSKIKLKHIVFPHQLTFNPYLMASTNTPADQSNAGAQKEHINKTIQKDVDKIVTKCDIQEVADQCSASANKNVCYCRCWQSKKFPLCDGSHNAWNKETGDNVGPLIITKKE